jgi:hypothetical protein
MDNEEAQGRALRTGLRAAQLGLTLTNKGDPDIGELAAACQRRDVPLKSVLIGE